ncbi:NACHT domain-containing protein [Streptomyces sp. Tu 4128]|uniref:NACHT domain-containing protein n=1 Tax=Streptomyces sp. Tu 4128 TaxID=1120314 RepID=UPI000F0385EA|nr:NACHT domain-containing protein [Streptomyces sp. Tu 4128]
MLKRWSRLRKKGESSGAKTIFGDVEISGYFAAGRDIKIRKLAANVPSLWRESRADKVRQRLVTKLLPKWLAEEDLWSGDDGPEFPVTARYGVGYVAHPRREMATLPGVRNSKHISGAEAAYAFESSIGRLLVLGEPGAGKTYILRRIMRYSLERAKENSHDPIPFYLHVSSWLGPRREIKEWVIDTLNRQYGIHEQYLESWFADGELALFIDGLDELGLRQRRECIVALNKFLSRYPNLEAVVACRKREYEDARKLLALRGSIDLHPIEAQDLVGAISILGPGFEQLLRGIEGSRKFRSLLQNPLFLRLALITYRDVDAIGVTGSRDMESALLREYISHCEKRVNLDLHGPVQTSWLASIAQTLRARKLVSFYPDRAMVEHFPVSLEGTLKRAMLWSCFLAFVVPTIAVRFVMTASAEESTVRPIYWVLTFLLPLTFGYLAVKIAKDEFPLSPVSRTMAARKNVKLFFKRLVVVFIAQGIVAALLIPFAGNAVIDTIVVIGFPCSMMWPPMRMIWSSERAEKSRMPLFPGAELASLRRAALAVGLLVGGGFYACVSLSMYALYPALKSVLLFQPGINTLFYAVPIGLLAALQNGGADLIRRHLCMIIMAQRGLLPKRYFQVLDSLRKSSILIPRLGSFEFRHLMVRDYLAKKAPDSLISRRNISLVDERDADSRWT